MTFNLPVCSRRRGPMRLLRSVGIASILAAVTQLPVTAQIGATTDIITGVVLGLDGLPAENALVEATALETEITRTARTDADGRYTILFPDGGGQYRVTIRVIGAAPQTATLVRYADDDRLVWNVRMHRPQFRLEDIEIRARRTPVRSPDPPTPGSIERAFTPDMIARLPLDAADLNVLATLVPGVVGIAGTDSTAAAFSVMGQRPDANAVTLDGMSFTSGEIPAEGLRNVRVAGSTYDVSRGRFSGGMVAATSRGGSNRFQGAFRYGLQDEALSFETGEQSPFSSAFTQHQLSGGAGGPVIRDRLFFYVSGQARLRTDPLPTLSSGTATDLQRLGVHADSVARLVSIVDHLGASPVVPIDVTNRSNEMVSTLVRIDYLASNTHTLTLRGDWRGRGQEPFGQWTTALPETGGTQSMIGGGAAASLTSQLGVDVINELRAYVSRTSHQGDPYQLLPQGRVLVGSRLEDGTTAQSTLTFGGNARLPYSSRSDLLEVSDEISWLPGGVTHRYKLGGTLTVQRASDLADVNALGTFTYFSLADLEADVPASFTRTLSAGQRQSTSVEYGLYAGDVWRMSRRLQVSYGIRLERMTLTGAPSYNQALDKAFGVRTDQWPSETDLSPRVGFTWTLGGGFMQQPDLVVRGGLGKFRSGVSLPLASQTQQANGSANEEFVISCTGAAVPLPDWESYAADPSTIPESCVFSLPSLPSGAPNAAVFAGNFGASKAWRASFGVQRNLTTLFRLSVDAAYARGFDQYGFRDLNLATDGGFTLDAEGGRPVFVAPEAIDAATGAMSLADSRRHPSFGEVLAIGSDLESESAQVTVSLGGITRGGIIFNTSYAWSPARDQSSQSVRISGGRGGLFGATTAGDPNHPDWGTSDFSRTHSFLTTISYPFGPSLEITGIGRLTSGAPYTPVVEGDINGDGARNDRAFVVAPDATDTPPDMASAMTTLLAHTSAGARDCLERQFGKIAERNSCRGPWSASLDLQINYRPRFLGLNGRVSMSLATQNLLRGIDELIHGSEGARGWGDPGRPDPTLLVVTGFDPVAREFLYAVNERFGATSTNARPLRTPFQVGLQLRVSLGADRAQGMLDRMRGAAGPGMRGGGRSQGGPPGGMPGMGGRGFEAAELAPNDFVERFRTLVRNPAEVALEMADSLELTAEQITHLSAIRDSIALATDSMANPLQDDMAAAGEGDPRALIQIIRPWLQTARDQAARSREMVREVLTAAQWMRLPDAVRAEQALDQR